MEAVDFEKVFWTLQPPLLRYASLHLDAGGADDVVSETFVTLWGKDLPLPSTAVEERQLRALAYQVLTGHIRNEHRSRRRRAATSDRLVQRPVETSAPDHAREHAEHDAVAHWLGRLSSEDRTAVLLFNAGFDLEETATILGCSYAAAAKRRTRAKARLRAVVERERV